MSTDVNTKYQQTTYKQFKFITIIQIVNKPLWKVAVYIELIQESGKNYVFNSIKLLFAALALTVAP